MLLSTNGYSLIEGVRLSTPCSWVDLLIKLLDHSWVNVGFSGFFVNKLGSFKNNICPLQSWKTNLKIVISVH